MISLTRWGSAALVAFAMAGCGGDGGGDAPVTPPTASVKEQISAAAAVPANDTASNSSSAFTVVQGAGVTAVTVPASASPTTAASLTKVNFSVFSDGKVVSNLATSNVSFAIAKLVPGTNGNPDQWVNYIYRTESTSTAPNNVGNGPSSTPAMATATQATTDAKMSTTTLASLGLASQLVYNADGYYSYVFATDIRDPKKTNGVVFEPDRTHRVVIQLSYKNAAGETVLVNPYIDFTVDAAGKSVFVTDPSKTRKMADVTSCNGCHDKLALHGGGRVDTQYCVMCHNPGTVDANSGNNLNMATMIHKIHAGKLLANPATLGGEDYVIWGYNASKHDYAEVGFPQDLRNCAKCHTASNPNTPQGDNWKTKVSKEACLTCHASKPGSAWNNRTHDLCRWRQSAGHDQRPSAWPCHNPTSNPTLSPERVHWNQNEENAAKYKMNIEDVTYTQVRDPEWHEHRDGQVLRVRSDQ
jgi:OmcA/MtrC family decaheme c-type cytochrome